MKIKSMYICVKNMERAINFYTNFFNKKPLQKDPIYSIFEIEGFRFGLFAYKEMKEHHTFGSNCIPSIEVENIQLLKKLVKNLPICFPLTKIKNNYVIEFIDTEGNHIELTTKITQENNKKILLSNIQKLHMTKLSEERIKKNINIIDTDIIKFLKNKILDNKTIIYKKGKNWYCEIDDIRITINSSSFSIITVHKL